jgi:hypothetical protein
MNIENTENTEPTKVKNGLWLYKGCFIQKNKNELFFPKYEVYKNNKAQHYITMCLTFKEAKRMCEKNECTECIHEALL